MGRLVQGSPGDLLLNITLIRHDGNIHGALCSFQQMEQLEFSARKLESYKHLNRQLNAIFQSSSDGIWVCDGQARVINVNEASERLNGIKAGDVIGKTVREVSPTGGSTARSPWRYWKPGARSALFSTSSKPARSCW